MKKLLEVNPIKLNDPNSDYWLGFIASDGNIFTNQVKIELQEQDKSQVESFCKFFKGVKVRERYKKQFNKKMYLAAFNDIQIVETLKSLGISSKKSLNLNYLGKFSWPFLRGVFDGDGSISISIRGYGRVILYSSSRIFINQIKDFLNSQGFNVSVKCYDNRTKNPFYSIWITKKSEILKFYKNLYRDGNFYLERKKEKFLLIK